MPASKDIYVKLGDQTQEIRDRLKKWKVPNSDSAVGFQIDQDYREGTNLTVEYQVQSRTSSLGLPKTKIVTKSFRIIDGKAWAALLVILLLPIAAFAQTAATQLRQAETERAMLGKNLATAEGWLASAKSRLASAEKNVRTEPIWSTRMVRKRVDFANGRWEYRDVQERYQSGTKTILDPNLEKYRRDVAAYEGQVANGRAQLTALDQRIADLRAQIANAPAPAAPVAAVAPAPAAAVVDTAPAATPQAAVDDKPATTIPASAPLWKNPLVWLGGVIVLYLGMRIFAS